jgi:hypothetical protein
LWYNGVVQQSIALKVRACSDARILLARYFSVTDYDVYEIVIGANGNTISLIRVGIDGTVLIQQNTNNILHCTYGQWIWVDWSSGISVGTGPLVGDLEFLTVTSLPSKFDISAVTIATGQGAEGFWEFTSVPG